MQNNIFSVRQSVKIATLLLGDETASIQNAATEILIMAGSLASPFLDFHESLLRKAIKVLKRLDKDKGIDGFHSTVSELFCLLENANGRGEELVQELSAIVPVSPEEARDNECLASWFFHKYFIEDSVDFSAALPLRNCVFALVQQHAMA